MTDRTGYLKTLLTHALGAEIEKDVLSETTVPRPFLQPIVETLAVAVIKKAKRRSELPNAIRPFASMRLSALITGRASVALWHTLWRNKEHPFVMECLNSWLDQRKDLVDTCRSGSIFDEAALETILKSSEVIGQISELGCVLWILGLDDPDRQQLFRFLMALFRSTNPVKEPRGQAVAPKKDKAAEDRLHEEQRAHRKDATEAKRQQQEMERRLERQERELKTLSAAATEAKRTADSADERARDAAKEAEKALNKSRRQRDDFDGINRQLQRAERELDRANRSVEQLKIDSDELRSALASAVERETDMTLQMAHGRAQIGEMEERIRELGSPRAALNLIREELRRAKQDKDVQQGGAQREAERRHAALKNIERDYLEIHPLLRTPRPVPLISRGPVSYRGLGGADEIGASSYLIELAGKRVLIDCGIRVGRSLEEMAPDLDLIDSLDAVVLTHAHADHVGWLPALIRRAGEFEIFASPGTQELLRIMMEDSRRQLERMMGFRRVKQLHGGIVGPAPREPYERVDLEEVDRRLRPLKWGEEMGLRGLRLSLHQAGHILGAASVLLEGDGRKVVVSGDVSNFAQRTVGPAIWPTDVENADLLILEGTYGGTSHPPRVGQEQALVDRVSRLVQSGGVALIACFALGRAQEVLSILSAAMRSGSISSFPVWVDGMIDRVNEVYRSHGRIDLGDNFHEVRTEGWEREEVLTAIQAQPCVVVATSGMLTGGPMVFYAQKLARNMNVRLFFSGYLDEESPGRRLLRLSEAGAVPTEVSVQDEYGAEQRIQVSVPPELIGLSAHADQDGLAEIVKQCTPAHVVLVHAESLAREALAERLARDGFRVEMDPRAFDLV